MGTEDRVKDPAKMVAANPVIIPFVTFPGAEIKDLIVHDPTPAATQSLPAPPKDHSAPRNAQHQQKPRTNNNTNPPRPPAANMNNNNNNRRPQNQNQAPNQNNNNQQQVRREPRSTANEGGNAGTGAHLLKLREKKAPDGMPSGNPAAPSAAGEFDFTVGLDMFKKDDVLAKVAGEASEEQKVDVKYKKDDFFDSLSCDIKDRQEGRKTRMSASEERNLNQDTFGAIALQGNNRRYFSGGRGGGGGGYGGQGQGQGQQGGGGGRGGGRGRGYGGGGRGRGRGSYGNGGFPTAAKA